MKKAAIIVIFATALLLMCSCLNSNGNPSDSSSAAPADIAALLESGDFNLEGYPDGEIVGAYDNDGKVVAIVAVPDGVPITSFTKGNQYPSTGYVNVAYAPLGDYAVMTVLSRTVTYENGPIFQGSIGNWRVLLRVRCDRVVWDDGDGTPPAVGNEYYLRGGYTIFNSDPDFEIPAVGSTCYFGVTSGDYAKFKDGTECLSSYNWRTTAEARARLIEIYATPINTTACDAEYASVDLATADDAVFEAYLAKKFTEIAALTEEERSEREKEYNSSAAAE